MMMNPSRSPYIRDHAPGGRSGPNHCQACSERWPCDWAVLCEIVEEAEATGRAAVRALWQTHVWKHGGDAAFAERCDSPLCQDITAVLATDTARAWREDGE